MTNGEQAPCEHCQQALHLHKALEYLFCGHHQVVAFRFGNDDIEYISVTSMDEAIALIQESGQQALPLQMPA